VTPVSYAIEKVATHLASLLRKKEPISYEVIASLIKYSIVELTLESKENAEEQSVTVRVMDLVRETPAFVKVISRV
jgi:hypothetical protein